MELLQLAPAKLLYFATELQKRKVIDEKEKIQLKEYIIAEDPNVYTYLERYERNSDEQEFIDNLLTRVRVSKVPRQSGILFDSDSKKS